MPRTAQIASFGWDRLSRRGGELRNATARQLLPALGIALMVASALLCLALLTYNPGDPSLDTAAAEPPRNYLGHFGALVADLVLQYLGLAAYLLPAVMLGWAFGLLLQHPLRRPGRKLLLLPLGLALGAAAFAILRADEALPEAGGLIGSLLLGLAGRAGLGALELPAGDDRCGSARAAAAVDHRPVGRPVAPPRQRRGTRRRMVGRCVGTRLGGARRVPDAGLPRGAAGAGIGPLRPRRGIA